MLSTPLRDAYLARCDGAEAPAEAELADLCAVAERRWPDLGVDRVEFAGYLGARGVGPPNDDAAAELYLACAVAGGDERAVRAVHDEYVTRVGRAVAHMKLERGMADEVEQQVAEKLLVATDGEPTYFETYAGHGRLHGLVKVMAVRMAISMLRKNKREVLPGDEGLFDLAEVDKDPELAMLKGRYRDAFRTSFEQAVRELGSRDRNLLRLHLLDGVTLEALASMYGVHRATVVRWLAKARERVLSGTRRLMSQTLDVETAELESVMELIRSKLDVSVRRLLETMEGRTS